MLKSIDSQKLFEKLPDPLSISQIQIDSSYQSLYDKIYDSFSNNDFHRIYDLLNNSQNISHILQFKPSNDSFIIDFVKMLYQIITLYPVKYYTTQLIAVSFLNEFLANNKKINNLVLDWHSYYKVMKYYTLSNESFFIRGSNFTQSNIGKNKLLNCFFELSLKISKYFADEIEIEKNSKKIKTNTTAQLVKKFIPHISANGQYTTAYLTYFRSLCPPHKGRYQLYINFLLLELRDTSKYECAESILAMILQAIQCNIEDDFSFLLPIVSQLISTKIFQYKTSDYPNRDITSHKFYQVDFKQPTIQLLPNIVIALFISPTTRKKILEILESFFVSFKSVCHPSVSSYNPFKLVIFIDHLVCSLRKDLKKLSSEKVPKYIFNMNADLAPSKDEIHQLLSMTSEIKIFNINECSMYEPLLIETTLDPLTVDHYFEIGFQCINMMDAYGVARSGWTILTALINSIEKNEIFRDNFETIFEIAVNNLYRPEIQLTIAHFLSITFLKIPFNKEKTLKGCEYFNFTSLAYSFFSNLLSLLRSLPSMNGEEGSKLNPSFSESIIFSIITMLQKCDNDVMEELLPLFTALSYDTDIAQSYYYVEIMTANYCFFATQKQAQAIAKAFKRQLELPNSHSMFYFLSIVYSTALISNLKTLESVKQTTDVFIKYTKSDDEKIRKIAWKSIAYSLSIFNRIVNVKVTLKPDKMKENSLENANLEDFDIKWNSDPDLSILTFEIFDPIFDQLLTVNDSNKINQFLNDVGDEISYVIQLIPQFNDGNINDEVNEAIIDPIHNISEVYKKTPIRDKFIKCVIRVIKDFNENEKIVTSAINSCLCLFYPYLNTYKNSIRESIRLLNQFSIRYDHLENHFNSCLLFNDLVSKFNSRKQMILIPLTDNVKQLILTVVDLLDSKYQSVQRSSSNLLQIVLPFYTKLSKTIIENMINNIKSIQFNTFINFLSLKPILNFILNNDDFLCKTMIIILNNFDFKDKKHLINLKRFMLNVCINDFPFETPKNNNQEYINLLTEIEEKYLNQNQNDRTFQYILMLIILMCLKRVYTISDKILVFILEKFIQYDQEISDISEVCLSNILNRRAKFTREKIEVKKHPNIADFPNILDQVSVKFKEGGVYFPVTLKTFSSKELLFELTEEYQPEKLTENDRHIDNTMIEISKDVAKVFNSFKNIDIDWKIKEEDKIYDTEYLFDQSNGYFMYRDSFYHKKFEFKNDQILIKYMPLILASAANLINENNLYTCLRFHYIWEQIALNVGPFCIDHLNRLLVNYLTQYYSMNARVTSKILFDLISGFMKSVCYWDVEDRIKFFKLVALPAVCIISLNKNTAPFAEHIITMGSIHTNPFCFAPLIKVLFELSPKAPNYPLFSRYLVSIISKQPTIKPFQFFNSIDQLKDKYITPFVDEMDYYNINDIDDIINLLFSLVDCCSFSNENSPIFSKEIESKKIELIKILENILEKNAKKLKLKRILIRVLTLSFNCFNESSYDLRMNIAPIFVKHLHTIFYLLNGSNIKDEERFINSFSLFIGNTIFINNNEIEFDFVSLLIKEMMNSSLPMQLILLESLNKMLESNIFNIPFNDYKKYEEIILDYGEFEKMKNLGNELRMKIAKILGIFEIRNCTLNCNITKEKADQKLIDNEVLKAASIILNSYLFDRADDRVTKSFDLMDECCSIKNVKNREFFKNVSKIFINRHSEHVINEAANMVIQYKNILTPSYLC